MFLGTRPHSLASSNTIDLSEFRVVFTFFFISLLILIGHFFVGDRSLNELLLEPSNKVGITFCV